MIRGKRVKDEHKITIKDGKVLIKTTFWDEYDPVQYSQMMETLRNNVRVCKEKLGFDKRLVERFKPFEREIAGIQDGVLAEGRKERDKDLAKLDG